jgi:hypothetical protein
LRFLSLRPRELQRNFDDSGRHLSALFRGSSFEINAAEKKINGPAPLKNLALKVHAIDSGSALFLANLSGIPSTSRKFGSSK